MNSPDDNIHEAAEKGDLPRLACIISGGCDVNMIDGFGATALHSAASKGHVEAMALLLHRGANLAVTNDAGRTALHCAAENDRMSAVALLVDWGASVGAVDDNSETPLDVAVNNGYFRVSEKLRFIESCMCEEWRPHRHTLYPTPFRAGVATVLALWSWNSVTAAPWHPESAFPLLSLELLFEIFIWMAVDIAKAGYVVVQRDQQRETLE